MNHDELEALLNQKVMQYNCTGFIDDDPVQIPHLFSDQNNIEIAGFLTSLLAWGQRNTIIKNMYKLINMMENNPFMFVMNAKALDLKIFKRFVHRTFNGDDCIFTILSLQNIYQNHGGLQTIFSTAYKKTGNIEGSIDEFRKIFFELKHSPHVEKHIPNIAKGSAAKRLNLFLKWMVRKDHSGVDFGIWNNIPPSALFIPLDIHTGNAARALGLLSCKQNNWKAVKELTQKLALLDPHDPVKYDYALFCLSRYEHYKL